MLLLRKYLVGSLIFHLLIVLVASLIALRTQNIKQTFIVLGAHSHKPTAVSYKSFKTAVPFMSHGSKSKTGTTPKPSATKKIAPKKTFEKKKVRNIKKQVSPKIPALKESKVTKKPQLKELTISGKQQKVKKITVSKNEQPKDKKQPNKPEKLSLKKPKEKESPKQEIPQKLTTPKEIAAIQPIKEENPGKKHSEPVKPDQHILFGQEKTILPDAISTEPEPVELANNNVNHDLGTIVVGDNAGEQITEYQSIINQEASRVWRPPVGVSQGTTCFVTFTIAQDGTHESDLNQNSSVIIYDLSVMRAARAMKFPKSLWGKQFRIAFCQ